MTKIEIELPDETAESAREAGLLTPQSLDRLLMDAIRRQRAADRVLTLAERAAVAGIEPLSAAEIESEIEAARAERQRNAGGP